MFTNKNGRAALPLKAVFIPILHRVGFNWLLSLPKERWALTSPFQPYKLSLRYISVYFPWSRLHLPLTGTLALRCSDFPHADSTARNRII